MNNYLKISLAAYLGITMSLSTVAMQKNSKTSANKVAQHSSKTSKNKEANKDAVKPKIDTVKLAPGEVSLVGRYMPENLMIPDILKDTSRVLMPMSSLVGKVNILLFWASWHEKSVAELNRFDELQKKYKDKLNVFAVTNERERTVRKFLKDKKYDLNIVVDDELSTLNQLFPHAVMPHLVLIDPELKICAITEPFNIIGATIELVALKQPIDFKEKKDQPFDLNIVLNDLQKDSLQFTKLDLTPFNPKYLVRCVVPGSGKLLNRRISYINMGIKNIYQDIYQMPDSRTLIEAKDPNEYVAEDRDFDHHYCLDVIVPPGAENQLKLMLRDYLHHTFKLKSKTEKRKVKVYLLSRIDSIPFTLPINLQAQNLQPFTEGQGQLNSDAASMEYLGYYLEKANIVNMPIINNTNLTGIYKMNITFPSDTANPLKEALKKLGLQLVEAEKEVDILVLYEGDTPTQAQPLKK